MVWSGSKRDDVAVVDWAENLYKLAQSLLAKKIIQGKVVMSTIGWNMYVALRRVIWPGNLYTSSLSHYKKWIIKSIF